MKNTSAATFRNSFVSGANLVCLVALCVSSSPAAANVYTLLSDSPQLDDSPFGFSGTISTNSVGSFIDTSFIADWSITLHTPGESDGVTTEILTPANSAPNFVRNPINGLGALVVTPAAIKFSPPDPFGTTLQLTFTSDSGTRISLSGVYFGIPSLVSSRISFLDLGETPTSEVYDFAYNDDFTFTIATSEVPEPSAGAVISLLALTAWGTLRRRNA